MTKTCIIIVVALVCLCSGCAPERGYAPLPENFADEEVPSDAVAQFNRGLLYAKNEDYKQAAYWFKKAAQQGLADAQNNLALIYADGKDVPQDEKRAAYWFKKAAAQGFVGSRY